MAEDLKSSEIWVTSFNEEAAQNFREAVLAYAKIDPTRPITVYIDSFGGQVDALAKMIETMDEVPNPIITACVGKAMSCGAILLSHGDVRFCGKHSRIMVHEISAGTSGDVHDMHADVQEARRLNEHFMGLLAKNCGFKNYSDIRQLIKQQDGRDRYMSASDALSFGLVDAIGTPRLSMRLIHEISVTPEKSRISKTKKAQPKKTSKKTTKSDTNKKS